MNNETNCKIENNKKEIVKLVTRADSIKKEVDNNKRDLETLITA